MEPRLREIMLAKGEIDAITGFVAPSLISLNEAGVKDADIVYFNYKDYGVNVYGNAILANERFIKEQPQAIAAFLRAYTRAMKDTLANPMEGIRCTKQREAILVEEIELKRLTTILDNYVLTPNVRANGLGAFNKIRLDTQVDDVVAAFQLKVRPDTDLLIDRASSRRAATGRSPADARRRLRGGARARRRAARAPGARRAIRRPRSNRTSKPGAPSSRKRASRASDARPSVHHLPAVRVNDLSAEEAAPRRRRGTHRRGPRLRLPPAVRAAGPPRCGACARRAADRNRCR